MGYDISPDKQNIDGLFSNTRFHIDFYQREYKWSDEPVKRLLDDVFYKFSQEYANLKSLDPSKENIVAKYSWYYLNTYVTNGINGRIYVVDGQQRLTTLSLILIKLCQLCEAKGSKLKDWVDRKIVGRSGYDNEFWINHEKSNKTQEQLYQGVAPETIDMSSGDTSKNLVNNFIIISKYLDKELTTKHKLETFIFYLLHRVVLINLSVEQTDVPMVFEVINDRGVRLKPYEILKGKLLGQIDKQELTQGKYAELWEKQAKLVNDFKEDELDNFFLYYLRAKHADTVADTKKYDSEYHRVIFSDEIDKKLHLKHNPEGVKNFLKNEFKYYSALYAKMLKYINTYSETMNSVFFNKLNEQDSQFMLVLSGCSLNDQNEEKKIQTIASEVDRFFSLLQLQNGYDSNSFSEMIYLISAKLREKPYQDYRKIFDEQLLTHLTELRSVKVSHPFQYTYFRETGNNLNSRYKRYYFTRIEKFLADNMNLKMKHDIGDLVTKTGSKTGFHIEHILANNGENLKLFKNDEELFERERNRLGGILLLKGKDNQSSNDENYQDKLKSYANTLYWNETLRADSYKSKLDIRNMKKRHQLDLEPLDIFGPTELEKRHKLLFEISKIIWE